MYKANVKSWKLNENQAKEDKMNRIAKKLEDRKKVFPSSEISVVN